MHEIVTLDGECSASYQSRLLIMFTKSEICQLHFDGIVSYQAFPAYRKNTMVTVKNPNNNKHTKTVQ